MSSTAQLRRAPTVTSGVRADIQGLRALAVVAVIFDHIWAWPSGGFVGVDVFFVISGFLITGLLLREHERTNHISFTVFYQRRIKRIIPAATLVLLVTVGTALLLFNRGRFYQTFWDAIWAFFSTANWHFAATGTDYFLADGPVSPLQHYWSLSVEEQFYFVWPWLMLAVLILAAKVGVNRRRLVTGLVMAIIIGASFVWAMFDTQANPTLSYFSTLTRAWELGVGALIAITAPWWSQLPARMRPVLAWVGLLGIIVSIFVINGTMPFPAPWVVLPVVATALVLAAGIGGEQRFLFPLTNRVSGYLGNISYSLYLWHFPVIIFAGTLIRPSSPVYSVVVVAAIAVLSALAYNLVELPLHKSPWLGGKMSRHRRRSEWLAWRRQYAPAMKRNGLAGASLLALGVVVLAILPSLSPNPAAGYVPPAPTTGPSTSPQADAVQAQLSAALSASTWPEFNPPIVNLADQRVPQWTENGCLNVTARNFDLCSYGASAPTRTAVVMGDSIATSWLPAVISALEPLGYSVQALTKESCPIARTDVFDPAARDTVFTACASFTDWAQQKVQQLDPDLIILSDSFLSIKRLASQAEGPVAESEWTAAYAAALAELPARASKVSLMPPPGAQNLQSCYTPLSQPGDCIRSIQDDFNLLLRAETSAATTAGTTFINTQPWFCIDALCPAFVGTSAVYADSGHLTATYSESIGAVLQEKLLSIKIAPPSP
ncbi:acyltransferase family protein [Cryobacterium sp. TMS1-20-1]|uniref:acyltransferase family protein n=1 Tax=Cryobacterium sp. TMS1-20-1 TaxID=1259223 RepID=UPI00141AE0B9|nr:acyltransferase family protein [Cryobacterium sp. TMS1-20-1]